jgi:hypothetical protein
VASVKKGDRYFLAFFVAQSDIQTPTQLGLVAYSCARSPNACISYWKALSMHITAPTSSRIPHTRWPLKEHWAASLSVHDRINPKTLSNPPIYIPFCQSYLPPYITIHIFVRRFNWFLSFMVCSFQSSMRRRHSSLCGGAERPGSVSTRLRVDTCCREAWKFDP